MPESTADSSSDEHEWQDEKEDMLMMVMVVLLMLLSVVIWVAFCVAALLTAAINRAASTNEADRHNVLPIYITTLAHELNVFGAREEELPTYEEALSMSCTPSPNPVAPSNNRDRIAPDRPGSLPTIVLPPSYESSIRHEAMLSPVARIHSSPVPTSSNAAAPSTSTSPPIYIISGNMHVTEC
uniref:Transmembrane protein n=1 Tax=Caenorhabditis tropicalis TaxID=1561998 RepID=A0A1I7V3L3_9PELO